MFNNKKIGLKSYINPYRCIKYLHSLCVYKDYIYTWSK